MAAIEDVDYLWENCEKDSHLIYLDSEKRDKRVYPHPNHYSVEFQIPIKLVYGYDILDAMIPTTMFNVEPYNNLFVVGVVRSTRPDWQTMQFDGQQFYSEFAVSVPEIIQRFLDPTPGSLSVAPLDRMAMYGVDHQESPNSEFKIPIIVFQKVSIVPTVPNDPGWTILTDQNGMKWYAPPPVEGDIDRTRYTISVSNESAVVTFWMNSFVTELGSATMMDMGAYDIMISVYNVTLPVQNYENTQLQQNLGNALSAFDIMVQHTSAIPDQANKFTFAASDPFFFNMQASTCSVLLGFDELTEPSGVAGCYNKLPAGLNPTRRMFASFFNPETNMQEIVTPGLLNLGGVRYLVLRCPELEAHAFSGKSFTENTTGLGIFKLVAAANGISSLRFDYTNFVVKPFHPIGKLSRLTVRFEQSNREMYDFKGINHHILLSIKYLVPSLSKTSSAELRRYQIKELNDEYDPNVLKFLMKTRKLTNDEEPDENNNNNNNNKVQLPASSLESIRELVKSMRSMTGI